MSQKEFQRVKVIENAAGGRLSVSEASRLLQLSERQVQRIYNLARIHGSLRIAPSRAAGLSDRVWSLEHIVMMADSYTSKLGKRGTCKKTQSHDN